MIAGFRSGSAVTRDSVTHQGRQWAVAASCPRSPHLRLATCRLLPLTWVGPLAAREMRFWCLRHAHLGLLPSEYGSAPASTVCSALLEDYKEAYEAGTIVQA